MDIVDPVRRNEGWEFTPSKQRCTPDSINGFDYLRDVYTTSVRRSQLNSSGGVDH